MSLDPEQQKPFPELLDDLFTDPIISVPLLFRLTDLGGAELEAFKGRWPGVDAERRRMLVRHLADITEGNYLVDFSPLFVFCLGDESPAVRVAALDGLWDDTNLQIVPSIIELLQHDPEVEVQTAAAQALAHYVLMAEWGEIPTRMTPQIVAALLATYEKPETAVSLKRAALEALGAASHPRIPTLIRQAYNSKRHDLQLSAVFAMGSSADERWLPQILDALESDSDEIRLEAARAAGSIGAAEALPQLAHLAVDDNLEVALAVVEALGQIGGETAYDMLMRMSEDDDFYRLHDAVEEALEEIDWLGGPLDLLRFGGGEDEENEHDLLADDDVIT